MRQTRKERNEGRQGMEEDRLNISSYKECKIYSESMFRKRSSLLILSTARKVFCFSLATKWKAYANEQYGNNAISNVWMYWRKPST